jgi:uncharacterized protein (DUF885 family)
MGQAFADSAADAAFEVLAEQYLGDLTRFSPVGATLIGDHSADDQLDQVDTMARSKNAALYGEFLDALDEIDVDSLSRANQVDAEMLRAELQSSLWSLETLQQWAWNPLVYINISGSAIYGLVARDFAPIDERLANVASRLAEMPRFLEQARASIEPERVPKIHAEKAVQQNPGLLSIIETMVVPHIDTLAPESRDRLNASIETARDAIAEHQTWLEEELLPRAAGNFRIGAELFDAKLAFALNSPLGRKDIKARAEDEYEAVRNAMYEIAKEVYAGQHPYTTFPDTPDEAYKQTIIRAGLEQAYQQLPPRDGIVGVAKEQLRQATEFVIEHNIVTMPDDPVDIIIMPEFQRGVSVAYLDPPGPLDVGLIPARVQHPVDSGPDHSRRCAGTLLADCFEQSLPLCASECVVVRADGRRMGCLCRAYDD